MYVHSKAVTLSDTRLQSGLNTLFHPIFCEVVYEVNIDVAKDIEEKFQSWLKEHIEVSPSVREVLTFNSLEDSLCYSSVSFSLHLVFNQALLLCL